MKPVKQKEQDYCFIACLTSTLLDSVHMQLIDALGYNLHQDNEYSHDLQELIMNTFPDILQKDGIRPGIIEKFEDVKKIFMELGISSNVNWKYCVYDKPENIEMALAFLKNPEEIPERIFIHVNSGGHVVRLNEVNEFGVRIMEPGYGDFVNWTWCDLRASYYAITAF